MMLQPRLMAAKALSEVVMRHVGKPVTRSLRVKIKHEVLALLKDRGVDVTEHSARIKVSFIRADLPNMEIPDNLLAGVPLH